MMTRLYQPEDYEIISGWWVAHGWPKIAAPLLSPCGVVVINDKKELLAAAWLYMAIGCPFSMMEWTVTNPLNTAKQSYVAVAMLIQAMREVATGLKYSVMMTATDNPALIKMFERHGWNKTGHTITHLTVVNQIPVEAEMISVQPSP